MACFNCIHYQCIKYLFRDKKINPLDSNEEIKSPDFKKDETLTAKGPNNNANENTKDSMDQNN